MYLELRTFILSVSKDKLDQVREWGRHAVTALENTINNNVLTEKIVKNMVKEIRRIKAWGRDCLEAYITLRKKVSSFLDFGTEMFLGILNPVSFEMVVGNLLSYLTIYDMFQYASMFYEGERETIYYMVRRMCMYSLDYNESVLYPSQYPHQVKYPDNLVHRPNGGYRMSVDGWYYVTDEENELLSILHDSDRPYILNVGRPVNKADGVQKVFNDRELTAWKPLVLPFMETDHTRMVFTDLFKSLEVLTERFGGLRPEYIRLCSKWYTSIDDMALSFLKTHEIPIMFETLKDNVFKIYLLDSETQDILEARKAEALVILDEMDTEEYRWYVSPQRLDELREMVRGYTKYSGDNYEFDSDDF